MKTATCAGALLGLALLLGLAIHTDLPAMVGILGAAGWRLLWLIPYRALFYLLYAGGWLIILSPRDLQRRAGLGYTFWITAVRDAVDRLLPVASVGGSVVGIRLMRWRGLDAAPVGASVIVEILLTLLVSYVFTAMGLMLLLEFFMGQEYRRLLWVFLLSIPIPAATLLLLRYGSVFAHLQKLAGPWAGARVSAAAAMALDQELRVALRRGRRLSLAASLQLAALISGSFEIWLALRLFGHPVGIATALVLESLTSAVRHVAFMIPAGLGVQEAGLMVFGQVLGIDHELALSVSLAKRMREILWGLPALMSWQWQEVRRLHSLTRSHT